MSPRAAWRLEEAGFGPVYDYAAGKGDWLAADLTFEGTARLAGMFSRRGVATVAEATPAAEALRIGLVNRVVPQNKFMDEVNAYANDIAEGVSPRSTRVIKRQVYEAMFQSHGEALDTASEEMRASLQCEDFEEGVAHFVEKRAPAFTGR